MPNWTANTIRAHGAEADLRAFIEAVKWQDQVFDFNRLIPMPTLLRHTSCGYRTIDGEDVQTWYLANPDKVGADEDGSRLSTPEEEATLRDIGYANWYDWSIAKWGTKWNAVGATIYDSAIASGVIEIKFDTAWDAPKPIFHRLFELFPHISFECAWQDEGETHFSSIRHDPSAEGDES